MMQHIIVCPFNQGLIDRLHSRQLVIQDNNCDRIHDITRVGNRQNRIHSIFLNLREPFGAVPFHESWKGIPLNISCPEMGFFKDVAKKLPLIKQLKLRVFLSSDHKNTYTQLRILSSLGIPCGIMFGELPVHWEALNDLMVYSVYGKAKHASIEPFQYIISHYRSVGRTDFSSVYFDNPMQFLHCSAEGKIALSAKDLAAGNFISENIDDLDRIQELPAFAERKNEWQKFFLKNSICASCPGWRVCLGKYAVQAETDPGCKQFYADTMDAADFYRMKNEKEQEVWR